MSATPTFYIFHGEDRIGLDEALARMKAALGEDGDLNRSEFDGAQTSVAEALAAVKSLPFLAEKRLVIVRGMIKHLSRRGAGKSGKRGIERLLAELPKLPSFSRLALVETETINARNPLLAAAKKMDNGYIGAFPKPRNLAVWIDKRAREHYGADLTRAAAFAIANVVDDDLLRADSELHKLALYVDGERAIDESDVAALTPHVPESNVFELVDALALGDGARALELIDLSLRHNPGESGFRLFGMIARQFRLLLMTRDHIDRGGGASPEAIARALGIGPYPARKLAGQARRFRIEQMDAILKRLQRYDQEIKTGHIEARLALDVLVASLSKE